MNPHPCKEPARLAVAGSAVRRLASAACIALAVGAPRPALAQPPASQPDSVDVVVKPDVKHQTILGWSITPVSIAASDFQREQMLDLIVNDLGLTRVRWGQSNGNRAREVSWEPDNDNADPYDTNLEAFGTGQVDREVAAWIKPFKRRVEANGDPFSLWISPSFFDGGSTGTVPPWLLHSPAEYSEFATSFLLYLKRKHGVEADQYVICNEPGNHNAFSPAVVARMVRHLGPRLEQLGLKTDIQFPDGVNAGAGMRYVNHVGQDENVWRYVGVLSYHRYGPADPFRGQMLQIGQARRIPTAQSELMGDKFSRLCDDLTIGGVSYWSVYGWGGIAQPGADGASVAIGKDYWALRQVAHYVRPGAVRIEARASDPAVRALAFARDGKITLVLINDAKGADDRPVTLRGLPAGRYGLCQSVNRQAYRELGAQHVAHDGRVTLTVPRGAVLTVYPHPGANQPPTPTHGAAAPAFLTQPASRITLSAAAQDPDGDDLTFTWALRHAPSGADVVLAAPHQPSTAASGLTAPGEYAFVVTVADPTHHVRREVRLNVFAGNQPPAIFDVHNRIPVALTLPQSSTLLRAAWRDVEADKPRVRWTVVSTPAGASVQLGPVDKAPAARRAAGLTVPGDYVFRVHVNDGSNEPTEDLKVTVHPENRDPLIRSAAAKSLGQGKAELSAAATDPDEDLLTYWWGLKRSPAGARPALAKPGRPTCQVAGLSVPGDYVFTLTVIDRDKAVTQDVRLRVP